jgi:ABC-2 type transport system ATP-binding protein
MPDPLNILELENLEKTFDSGHRALVGLSLAVPAGSIFGFIGLNGAGKTTTIRIIAGLTAADSGTVRIGGRSLAGGDRDYLARVGFVLDEPLYFDWMAAREYLAWVGRMYGLRDSESDHRTAELLDFFDLPPTDSQPIRLFSTGMKKKVSLAAAIIHKPDLIILDEPLEGIDALAANAIKETLTLMASRGSSIFITSHVLDTVERFCSEVAILHQGRLVLRCPTGEIRQRAGTVLNRENGGSLEELFVELVAGSKIRKPLSYV